MLSKINKLYKLFLVLLLGILVCSFQETLAGNKNNRLTSSVLPVVQAKSIDWPVADVRYYLRDIAVQDLFRYIGEDFKKKIILSNLLTGVVNLDAGTGNIKNIFAKILENLNAIFYFDGDAIYVYHRNETQQMNVKLTQIKVDELIAKLKMLAIYDTRFVWQKIDNHNVNIFGPERYLQAVRDVIQKLDTPRQVVVKYFPLHHAMAADRKVNIRGKEVTIEGVENILKSLINAKDSASLPSSSLLDEQQVRKNIHNLSKNYIGHITHDNRSNAIIVKDYAENMPAYADLIMMLDRPMPMIEIMVSIVDIDVNHSQQLGIDWNLNIKGSDIETLKPKEEHDKSLFANLTRMFKGSVLSNVDTMSILSRVKLMENKGYGKIISRPSVIAKNNMQATLDYTNTFFIPSSRDENGHSKEIVTGVLLKVTPRVSVNSEGERVIHLDIDIKDSNINHQEVVNNGLPRISKTSINTSASLTEGTSFVIGGYYNEFGSRSIDQVPIISNIPILGSFFKMRNRNVRKFERIFFIVPGIVSSSKLK